MPMSVRKPPYISSGMRTAPAISATRSTMPLRRRDLFKDVEGLNKAGSIREIIMTTVQLVTAIVVFIIAVILAVLSYRSFKNRGFLLNNAYIYASKKERETMNKKPHYRQSAIVFLLLSLVFIVIGLAVIIQNDKIYLLEIPLVLAAIIYAIVSSVLISRKEKK